MYTLPTTDFDLRGVCALPIRTAAAIVSVIYHMSDHQCFSVSMTPLDDARPLLFLRRVACDA